MDHMREPTLAEAALPGLGPAGPAREWDRADDKRALDELFLLARRYRTSREYVDLMKFIADFPAYSPFNAMLIHAQMPGAAFVAPASRWWKEYGRLVKPGERPIHTLQPKGPVMFVFDVSQTEQVEPRGTRLPTAVVAPFEVDGRLVGSTLRWTIDNAKRDGVLVAPHHAGSMLAGSIGVARPGRMLSVLARKRPTVEYVNVPLRYQLLISDRLTPEARYATLVLELAHLYCGHLGTPGRDWWPDREGLSIQAREFEAESVSYLVCRRLGLRSGSEEYLAHYLDAGNEPPLISLECVLRTSGLIEEMGQGRLPPREPRRLAKRSPGARPGRRRGPRVRPDLFL